MLAPSSEKELLAVLVENADLPIRVVGSNHSWSPLVKTQGTVLDMSNFAGVAVHGEGGSEVVTVGAGCTIKKLLRELNKRGLTLPSIGLITEQTIAGATATGTHGSGGHSLSHYILSVRIARYRGDGSEAEIVNVDTGDELRAARCALGCMGVIVSITLPCVPQYYVEESMERLYSIDDVVDREKSWPLQQFYLIPHSWNFVLQKRRVTSERRPGAVSKLYRAYWLLVIDIGLHIGIKLTASLLQSAGAVSFFFRRVASLLVFENWNVTDRSDKQLTMNHHWFRHLELELFVPADALKPALRLVEEVLKVAHDRDHALDGPVSERLQSATLSGGLQELPGRYTHHYPICVRKILADDTLVSMCSGGDWYAISLITYREPRDEFFAVVTYLAEAIDRLYGGRIHWGKWFPMDADHVARAYPELETFRQICHRFDPAGVFRNEFVRDRLRL